MCSDGQEAFVQVCHHKKTGGSTPMMFGIHFKLVMNNKTLNPLQIDHLSFLKCYEIMIKCKEECSVSTLCTCMCENCVVYVMHWECNA